MICGLRSASLRISRRKQVGWVATRTLFFFVELNHSSGRVTVEVISQAKMRVEAVCKEPHSCALMPVEADWDPYCPMRYPDWFDVEIDRFLDAIDNMPDTGVVNQELNSLRSTEMERWFTDHAQWAQVHRVVKSVVVEKFRGAKDRAATKQQKREVAERDNYRCRYCGMRVVPREVFHGLSRAFNRDDFSSAKCQALAREMKEAGEVTDISFLQLRLMHGIAVVMDGQIDHIIPLSKGGRTDVFENLVLACNGCNQGKWNLTLDQMKLRDPREREPGPAWDWHRLLSFA